MISMLSLIADSEAGGASSSDQTQAQREPEPGIWTTHTAKLAWLSIITPNVNFIYCD